MNVLDKSAGSAEHVAEQQENQGYPTGGDVGHYDKDWYRWYVLAILTGLYTFNFVDRQILVILQEPIKADMGLSDTQLGLLSGFAFAVIYVVAGIPIARMADKGNRRNIVTIALVVWSGMTAISGLSQNYWQLLLARIGVATGEAGGSPPSHSMISDIFKKEERATALSIYSTGINFGGLIGLLAGGWIAQYFDWRYAFFVVGIPGLAYAILVRYSVQEPPRGYAEKITIVEESPPMMEVVKVLISRATFRHMAIASGLHAFIGYGASNFAPSFYVRVHGMEIGPVGTWLAAAGITGAIGTFLGGYLTDKLMVKDNRWYLWVPALSTIVTLPVSMIIYNTGNVSLALSLQFVTALTFSMYLAPNLALAHSLVGIRMRAMSSAVLFFILNIIGLGLGPLVVGWVSDMLAGQFGNESIKYSLMSVVFIFNIWCVFHYWMASKTVTADLALVPKQSA
ncbi:MAG: putative MFS family arabinose efflux permease [Gammaproteobacteria bacterium]